MVKRRLPGIATFVGRILGNHNGRVHLDSGWHYISNLLAETWERQPQTIAPAIVRTTARKAAPSPLSALDVAVAWDVSFATGKALEAIRSGDLREAARFLEMAQVRA